MIPCDVLATVTPTLADSAIVDSDDDEPFANLGRTDALRPAPPGSSNSDYEGGLTSDDRDSESSDSESLQPTIRARG